MTGAPVALKPSPVVGSSPIVGSVRVPAGQRGTVVSQPLAVSLTQAPTHIQVCSTVKNCSIFYSKLKRRLEL